MAISIALLNGCGSYETAPDVKLETGDTEAETGDKQTSEDPADIPKAIVLDRPSDSADIVAGAMREPGFGRRLGSGDNTIVIVDSIDEAGQKRGVLRVYDASTLQLKQTIIGVEGTGLGHGMVEVAGKIVASEIVGGGRGKQRYVCFDAESGDVRWDYDATTIGFFRPACYAFDENHILVVVAPLGNIHASLAILDCTTGEELRRVKSPSKSSSFSKNYPTVAVLDKWIAIGEAGDGSGKVYLVNRQDFDQPPEVIEAPAGVNYFGSRLCASGDLLLVRCDKGPVFLMDVEKKSVLHTFRDPRPVSAAVFGERMAAIDNYIFISATHTPLGVVYCFDLTTGKLLETLKPRPDLHPNLQAGFGYSMATVGKTLVVSGGDVYLYRF
ncbi:MAG: PQQ-binding-like beta-propeller repeat protein [Planctomycetes bacterium]|nr:PQQ-binding-like beta-propeller repeat protein [Planctomycetota bacterium]